MKPKSSLVIALLMLAQLSCGSSRGALERPATDRAPVADWTESTTTTQRTDSAAGAMAARWTVLDANYPRMRSEYAMAYDAHNQRIIAFGGRTGFRSDFQDVDETWTFDYSTATWTDRNPMSSPPWRTSHTMVYDPLRHKVLLFGGNDFTRVFNDLWEYDYQLNTWRSLAPPSPPEARQMHGMTYVPERDIFVLFGGRRLDGGPAFNDLWAYDYKLNTWDELEPVGSPPAQDHVTIAHYDSATKLILYAGVESNAAATTWAYDLDTNRWNALDSADTPSADHSSLTYDPSQGNLVLFGSSLSKEGMRTWTYDYSDNAWSDITPEVMPDTYIEHDAMVYLSDHNVFIQYGGCCTDNTMELVIPQ